MTSQIDTAHYERAAAFAPPSFGIKLTGGIGDGYWIDDHRFFFCVGEADGDGTVTTRAKIADTQTGTVSAVIAPEALADLLSAQSEAQVDMAGLRRAQYDMPNAGTLVVTLGATAYHVALDGPALAKAEPVDPVPALHSPDGRYAAFRKDHAVWIKDRATGTAEQLTPDGEADYPYGAQPESGIIPLMNRKIAVPAGLWSADSAWFVTHRIDERHLPTSGLVEHVPAQGKRAVPHVYRVSAPEADLPLAEFVAYHLPTGRAVSASERPVHVQVMSPFAMKNCWFAGDCLYFLDWERFSAEVALVEMALDSGAIRTVLTETATNGWIDLHPAVGGQPIIRTLPGSGELICYSQADGHGHLYLHDLATGALRNRITQGEWMVREIVHVDEANRRILFLANGFEGDSDPGHRRLCAVNFDGSGFMRFVGLDGDAGALPDPVSGVDQLKPYRPSYAPASASADGQRIVLQLGGVDSQTRNLILDLASGSQLELSASNAAALWTAPAPQSFKVLAADGVTKLYGALYFPSGFDPAKSYPLVDYIYPGPQANWFPRRFASPMAITVQSVAELGMVGMLLETRGMPYRNKAFHHAGQGQLHEPQLSDHVAAIEQLCQRHAFLDRDRVGMFGQSGGGYATARALFDYPDMFKVGVSVCGNHDSRNYIAHWIDKYGARPGTPERDNQSNTAHAHKLQGKLLLIHGDMDDNVHLAHTLALSAALIAANKDFDQLIVPNATHGVMLESPYAFQRLLNHFARHLIGAEPPAEFRLHWTAAENAGAARALGAEMR
jgi:dipeptidyl aminopeptidase/acylaminoacyl peptidase